MINERSLLQQGGKKDERHARSSKRDWGGNMNELIIFVFVLVYHFNGREFFISILKGC